jgi:hypothetical protein
MVGSLFQHHNIHAVGEQCHDLSPSYDDDGSPCRIAAVGADRIAKNGDTANKVSSIVEMATVATFVYTDWNV